MVLCSPRPSRLAVRDSVPCSAIITPVRAQMWLTLGRSASVRLRRERVASTGPRPRGRGRGPYENKEYKDPTASTGPRPRGRGRSRRPPRSATSSALQRGRDHVVAEGCASAVTPNRASSFNGAATTWSRKASVRQQPGEQVPELQRGRDHVVAEGRARRERASRRSKLQRGRDHVVAEGLDRGCSGFPHLGFNGAATTWSRKEPLAVREEMQRLCGRNSSGGLPERLPCTVNTRGNRRTRRNVTGSSGCRVQGTTVPLASPVRLVTHQGHPVIDPSRQPGRRPGPTPQPPCDASVRTSDPSKTSTRTRDPRRGRGPR